jgi:hypothetical protein
MAPVGLWIFPRRHFHTHKNVFSSPVYFLHPGTILALIPPRLLTQEYFLEKAQNEIDEKKKLPKRRKQIGFRPDRGPVDGGLHYLGRLFSRS